MTYGNNKHTSGKTTKTTDIVHTNRSHLPTQPLPNSKPRFDIYAASQTRFYLPNVIDTSMMMSTNTYSLTTRPNLKHTSESYSTAIRLSIRHAKRQARAHTRQLSSYGSQRQRTNNPSQKTVTDTRTPPHSDTSTNTSSQPQRPRLRQRFLTGASGQLRHTSTPQQTETQPNSPPTTTHIHTPRQHQCPTTERASTQHTPHSRASLHPKDSRWRPSTTQRETFLNFFRR